jgi:hypothetical protein
VPGSTGVREVASRHRVDEWDNVDSETAESWRCETIGLEDGAGSGSRLTGGEGRF